MNPLTLNAIGPTALGGISALQPIRVLAPQTGTTAGNAPAVQGLVQGLAQGLFQQTFQATAQGAVGFTANATSLAQEATASLLASLNAPQAAADTTPTPDTTTAPAAVPAPGTPTATSPATASTPLPTPVADLPTGQDGLTDSASPDFALQTALRFGAGVAAQTNATLPATDLAAGLVRDAAAVPRLRNLQPHAGGPGPEAFARPQAPAAQALRSYQTAPVAPGAANPGQLDLLV